MCAPCRKAHKARLDQQRREIKERKMQKLTLGRARTNGVSYSTEARVAVIQHALEQEPETYKDVLAEIAAIEDEPTEVQTPPREELPIEATAPPIGTAERAAYMRSFRGKSAEERQAMSHKAKKSEPRAERRSVRRPLSDAQESELLTAYTHTDESVDSITRRFGIRDTYIFNVLDRAGVSWRRKDAFKGQSFEQWQAAQNPNYSAPEAPKQKVLPPEIEAMRTVQVGVYAEPQPGKTELVQPASAAVEVSSDDDEPVWQISYVGRMLVRGKSIDEALANARRDGHLTEIVSVVRRPR
jgi:hypothetical protein